MRSVLVDHKLHRTSLVATRFLRAFVSTRIDPHNVLVGNFGAQFESGAATSISGSVHTITAVDLRLQTG